MATCPYADLNEGVLPLAQWGDIVTVRVGKERKQEFTVHEGLLRQHSLWFASRMNGNWGDSKHIDIEDDSSIFALFSEFMYRGRLVPPVSASYINDPDSSPPVKKRKVEVRKGHHDVKTLAHLFVFADMRQCPRLKCAVINAFHEQSLDGASLPFQAIDIIFNNTTQGSLMRKLLIDIFTTHSRRPWGLKSFMRKYVHGDSEPEFVADLVVALYDARNKGRTAKDLVALDYHDCEKQKPTDQTVGQPKRYNLLLSESEGE